MKPILSGLHHVTAITADAQKNIDFYCGVLGLRLAKLTVNFDDPGSYHLYYGDELGRPGTIMTFFSWPGAPRGRIGPPQVTVVAFAIPADASAFWAERLVAHHVPVQPLEERFGERGLRFADPDGLGLELVETDRLGVHPAGSGPVAPAVMIRGFLGVTVAGNVPEVTARLLTGPMGFHYLGQDGIRQRYQIPADDFASRVDVAGLPDTPSGQMGAGVVHHVAFRTPDDAQQVAWLRQMALLGYNVSPVRDRVYFHSIYFQEPGGVLFEIATDPPGFTADETPERLGTQLRLPAWLEPHRSELQKKLPRLVLPGWPPAAQAA